jgi:hypothetical protein
MVPKKALTSSRPALLFLAIAPAPATSAQRPQLCGIGAGLSEFRRNKSFATALNPANKPLFFSVF